LNAAAAAAVVLILLLLLLWHRLATAAFTVQWPSSLLRS
jgi:hypothetical protein